MTPWQFYDLSANAAGCAPRPLRSDYLIFGADNVSTRDAGQFGQRERYRKWACGLGPQVIDRRCRGGFIAVGIKNSSHKVKVHPYGTSLLVRLTHRLNPSAHVFRSDHVRLSLSLIELTKSAFGNNGTQINQMPRRALSRDQCGSRATHGMPHDHHIVITAPQGAAHRVRVGVEVCRPIVGRQIRRNHAMARLLQKWTQPFPTPCAMPRAMHQRKSHHPLKRKRYRRH